MKDLKKIIQKHEGFSLTNEGSEGIIETIESRRILDIYKLQIKKEEEYL